VSIMKWSAPDSMVTLVIFNFSPKNGNAFNVSFSVALHDQSKYKQRMHWEYSECMGREYSERMGTEYSECMGTEYSECMGTEYTLLYGHSI